MIKTNDRKEYEDLYIGILCIDIQIRGIEFGEDIELRDWIDIFFFEYYEIKQRNRDALLRSLFKSLTFEPLQHR